MQHNTKAVEAIQQIFRGRSRKFEGGVFVEAEVDTYTSEEIILTSNGTMYDVRFELEC
jgi:hypothetical protein